MAERKRGKRKLKESGRRAGQTGTARTLACAIATRKESCRGLAEKLGRENRLSLPRIEKIVVSMGVGSAITDKKHMEEAVSAMSEITGQKPLVCKARKSIANFRLREGVAIGCKVTLRGARMYEFLDRLISLALPRVRDFRGLNPNAFDGHGNYSLGLTEQLVFPELNPDKYLRAQGMNIAICCSAGSDDESREMLRAFGVPFRREGAERKSIAVSFSRQPRRTERRLTAGIANSDKETKPVASKSKIAKAISDAEVFDAARVALPAVRPAAGRVSQVRRVPDLLPQPGGQGIDSRREEGQLVE